MKERLDKERGRGREERGQGRRRKGYTMLKGRRRKRGRNGGGRGWRGGREEGYVEDRKKEERNPWSVYVREKGMEEERIMVKINDIWIKNKKKMKRGGREEEGGMWRKEGRKEARSVYVEGKGKEEERKMIRERSKT